MAMMNSVRLRVLKHRLCLIYLGLVSEVATQPSSSVSNPRLSNMYFVYFLFVKGRPSLQL